MTRLENFVDAEALDALHRPIAEARGLPGSVYGEEFYELERRELFPCTWCPVAVASEIPKPGDVLPVDLAGSPLLLVRDGKGRINAFHNICRHRGMRIVTKAARRRDVLRCPWHAWTYDLEGRLIARRNFAGWGSDERDDLEGCDLGLKPVRTDQWNDYVFANIDGRAPPLEEHTRGLDELLAGYDFSAFRYAGMQECVYEGNWKVAIEGGIEEYHLPWGHPLYVKGVTTLDVRMSRGSPAHAGYLVIQSLEESDSPHNVAKRRLPKLAGVPEDRQEYYLLNLFPVGVMALEADHVVFHLFTPIAWNRTRIVTYHYFVGDAATDPAYAAARKEIEDAWEQVMGPDADFVKYVHDNARARDAAGILPRFSPHWEPAVQHFQTLVVETIQKGNAR